MTAPAQRNLFAAYQAGKRGVSQVQEHNRWFVREARIRAHRHALEHGTVTADDIRLGMEAEGIYPEHSNAWGAVFRGREWRWTGEYRTSRLVQGHGNRQRVWAVATGNDMR